MSSYVQLVESQSPDLWLKLNEASGTTMADSSGNGFDGTLNGSGAAYEDESFVLGDSHIDFNGSAYVTAPNDATWVPASGEAFTVELWLRVDAGHWDARLFSTLDGDTSGMRMAVFSNHVLSLSHFLNGAETGDITSPSNTIGAGADDFYFVTVSVDASGNASMMVDGSEVATDTGYTISAAGSTLHVGSNASTGNIWPGVIGHFWVKRGYAATLADHQERLNAAPNEPASSVRAGAGLAETLNTLAGTSGKELQAAANAYAGTTGKDLLGALNAANGTTGLGFDEVCRQLAGLSDGESGLYALRQVS